jgi:hypothetical protein
VVREGRRHCISQGLPPLCRSRPGVGRVHPLTEAYSSTLIMPMVSGEPADVVPPVLAGGYSGASEVKAVREGDLVTSWVWPP